MKTKRITGCVLLGFFVVALFQVLLDPLSSLMDLGENVQARVRLPFARRKWDAQNITHYSFDIRGYVPLLCVFDGNIEVRDGKVVGTGPRSDGDENLLARLPTLSSGGENLYFLCDARNYTMPLFFNELESSLHGSGQSVTEVSFDPRYGFISQYGFGNSGGGGLFSPRVSDCCGGFKIENFQILNEED